MKSILAIFIIFVVTILGKETDEDIDERKMRTMISEINNLDVTVRRIIEEDGGIYSILQLLSIEFEFNDCGEIFDRYELFINQSVAKLLFERRYYTMGMLIPTGPRSAYYPVQQYGLKRKFQMFLEKKKKLNNDKWEYSRVNATDCDRKF